MNKSTSILDKDYVQWVKDLSSRYRQSQIRASMKVNQEMLHFYWEMGRDIVEMQIEDRWGDKVIKNLSLDLRRLLPDANCFSRTNLYYVKKFYMLYSEQFAIVPQLEGQIQIDIFSIPWGHHKLLIDKCSENPQKAIFFIK